MIQSTKRVLFIALGLISLGLGVAGIFLPLVPTTPLILLAAFFFSRSSERLHQWLLNHRHLGPIIADWEQNGVIRLRVKIIATVLLMGVLSYPIFFMGFPLLIQGLLLLIMVGVLSFIWTRPSGTAHD